MSASINHGRRLLLTILAEAKKQNAPAIPEETLRLEVCAKTRPQLTEDEFTDLTIELLQREFIGFLDDGVDRTKNFFIKEAGSAALRS